MDMQDQDESGNVEAVRGAGGGGFQFRPVHGIGLGTLAIARIGGWALGINPLQMLGLLSGSPTQQVVPQTADQPADAASPGTEEDPQLKFVSQILRSTEMVWTDDFQQMGRTYEDPKLVLLRNSYPTACGQGLFYCPNDRRVYLDLAFFDPPTRQRHAPGQFAHAYVIGHEVGHHVQNLLGILGRIDAARARSCTAEANALSVKIKLQADCFAGGWARRAQQERGWRLEPDDIESALNAASQIGDDTLQKKAGGTVVPETFTHGTSAQRVSWFRPGIDSGDINQCDTFGTGNVARVTNPGGPRNTGILGENVG